MMGWQMALVGVIATVVVPIVTGMCIAYGEGESCRDVSKEI